VKAFIKNWLIPPSLFEILNNLKFKLVNQEIKALDENDLKDCEKGKRCFIVGTGSSIQEQNLKLLKDEIVIGVSGLFKHKHIEILSPKYYVNPPIFKSHSQYYEKNEFMQYLRDMDAALSDNTIMFFDRSDKKHITDNNIFEKKKIFWVNYSSWKNKKKINLKLSNMPSIWSVSESAIQIAILLDFKEIYLLGFDHNWFEGNFIYFTNDYLNNFDLKKVQKIDNSVDSEFQMRRHAQIFDKYKKLYTLKENIYNANANANSYVDTFPKVKYEELFK